MYTNTVEIENIIKNYPLIKISSLWIGFKPGLWKWDSRLCSEGTDLLQKWKINTLGIHKPEGKDAWENHLPLVGVWKWMLEDSFLEVEPMLLVISSTDFMKLY